MNFLLDAEGEIAADVLIDIISDIETDETFAKQSFKDHVKSTIKKDNEKYLTAIEISDSSNVLQDFATSSLTNLLSLTDITVNNSDGKTKIPVRRSKRLSEKDKKPFDK